MGVHDLAAWVTWFARDIDLRTPVNVIGCSLGGWVAAEIATVAPQFFSKMVLVGAMGIQPGWRRARRPGPTPPQQASGQAAAAQAAEEADAAAPCHDYRQACQLRRGKAGDHARH